MRKKFLAIMKTAFKGSDTKRVLSKYRDILYLYQRFMPVIKMLKQRGMTTGIDFGCGVGGLTVLGKLHGLQITGCDMEFSGSRYTGILLKLKKMGYPIEVFDTLSYPWPFEDDSLDFCLAFSALCEDYSPKTNENHMPWDGIVMKKRLREMERIIRPAGLWYVGGRKHYLGLKKSRMWGKIRARKEFKLKMWHGSGVRKK